MANTAYKVPSIPVTAGLRDSPGGDDQSEIQKILDMIGSKGGQTIVNAAGAGMQAYGASKDADASRAQNAHQFEASMAQRQLEGDQADQRARATAVTDASPMGDAQKFAQQQALSKVILGGARNFSAQAGDPAVRAAQGHLSGGLQLPTGGFDPAMLEQLFGDEATQASIAQRQKAVGHIDPTAPVMDLGNLFGKSADGSQNAFTSDIMNSNHEALASQMDASARQRAVIQRAIDEDISGEKQAQQKHGNIFGKILKGVGTAAGFIPGIGQILGPAATFAGGMVNGDGLKSSLINGGIAAIPGGGAAKGAAGAAKIGIGAAAKTALKNPALYAGLANGLR